MCAHHRRFYVYPSSPLLSNRKVTMASSQSEGPIPIEILAGGEIDIKDLLKLRDAGYVSVESVAYATVRKLKEVEGITAKTASAIQEASHEQVNMDFQDARTLEDPGKPKAKLTTGVGELDEALGGGLEAGLITEIFGESRTGKTQICHTIAVTCQLPRKAGGLNGRCLFIDTQKTFRQQRIRSIAQHHGLSPDTALDNIKYALVHNTEHQLRLLHSASELMMKDKYALLIVDSATAHFRAEYCGLGELPMRQQALTQFLSKLQKLANEFNIVVVITNQVVAQVTKRKSSPKPGGKTGGGNVIAHTSQTRLSLRYVEGRRTCKIFDSSLLPEIENRFFIEEVGVMGMQARSKYRKTRSRRRRRSRIIR